MKEKFENIRFKPESLAAINVANQIIAQYLAQGYKLTLRQLYYQHVARGFIENTEKNYKNLGDLISRARLAGLVDWDAIEDRTRNLRGMSHWKNPAGIIDDSYRSFFMNRWETQTNRVEVWIEKDALVGVISGICRKWDVDYFSCRGYVSQSEMYYAAKRLNGHIALGKRVVILHLGDHDPSGLDMTRDIRERLNLMLQDGFGSLLKIDRLALNFDQVEQYNPPPNPAKVTDSRFSSYQNLHGDYSWELDALEPTVLSELVEKNIKKYVDSEEWSIVEEEEEGHKELLMKVRDKWPDVVEFLSANQ